MLELPKLKYYHQEVFTTLSSTMIQVYWVYKKDCLQEVNKTNIYLATLTTLDSNSTVC